MSDRHYAYTVVLAKELKDEDSDEVIRAIEMIKGVAEVVPHIARPAFYVGREHARRKLQEELWDVLHKDHKAP